MLGPSHEAPVLDSRQRDMRGLASISTNRRRFALGDFGGGAGNCGTSALRMVTVGRHLGALLSVMAVHDVFSFN